MLITAQSWHGFSCGMRVHTDDASLSNCFWNRSNCHAWAMKIPFLLSSLSSRYKCCLCSLLLQILKWYYSAQTFWRTHTCEKSKAQVPIKLCRIQKISAAFWAVSFMKRERLPQSLGFGTLFPQIIFTQLFCVVLNLKPDSVSSYLATAHGSETNSSSETED